MKDLTIISKIALIATKNISFEEQMNSILEISGKYLQVSRSYIFIDDKISNTSSNQFEWCNVGVNAQIDNNQDVSYDDFPSFRKLLESENFANIENIYLLPKDISSMLEKQNIKSISIYPLVMKNKVFGFIGFDECYNYRVWNKAEQRILETLSGIISNMYEKNNIIEKFNMYRKDFTTFFDTIEEFIIVMNFDGDILFTNKYTRDKLKYDEKELIDMNVVELHPIEKKDDVRKKITAMINLKISYCPIEMINKYKEVINVETRTWLGKWKNEKCIISLSKNLSKDEESLQKFRSLFRKNPVPMLIVSVKTKKIIDINFVFTEKFGYVLDDINSINVTEMEMIIDEKDHKNLCQNFLKMGKIREIEIRITNKSGEVMAALISGDLIDIQGEKYYIAVIVDISEQKRMQNLYIMEKNRIESIIESSNIGTWEWKIDTGEITINEIWLKLIGYDFTTFDLNDIKKWMNFLHIEDKYRTIEMLRKHMKSKISFYDVDYRMKHKNGEWIWINDRGKVIEWSEDGKPLRMFGTHTDITEKKKSENKIKEFSIRDPLTNIYNRRYIFERLEIEIARSKRERIDFAVAILDIDRFKVVNDTYGHIAGDYILKEFTKLIANNLRIYDLLGRFGGEEFILILYGIDKKQAYKIIEMILEATRERFFIYKNFEIRVTFSAGIADISEFAYSNVSNDEIITLADKRLYEAKDEGRNKIKC